MEDCWINQDWKNYWDNYAILKTAKKEGHEEGRKEGRLEGRKEGREEIILNAIQNGFSDQEIYRLTHYPIEKIAQLRAQLPPKAG